MAGAGKDLLERRGVAARRTDSGVGQPAGSVRGDARDSVGLAEVALGVVEVPRPPGPHEGDVTGPQVGTAPVERRLQLRRADPLTRREDRHADGGGNVEEDAAAQERWRGLRPELPERPTQLGLAASTPPYISPSWLTWERASTCVPTWPPVTMISFAAEPPSGRTMSPCRRISVIRNPGWFGEHGIPVKNGWPRRPGGCPR